jgi:hypothetical protein
MNAIKYMNQTEKKSLKEIQKMFVAEESRRV